MLIFILIPLLPLTASLILALGGRRWGEQSHRIGIPAIGLSFGLSVFAFLEVFSHGPFSLSLYRLFQSGSLVIDVSFYVGSAYRSDSALGHRGKRNRPRVYPLAI